MEVAVKTFKQHLTRVVGDVRLYLKELTTILARIEASLNPRPLTFLPVADDGIGAPKRGDFLIGRPLESITDHPPSSRPLTLFATRSEY